MQRIQRKRTKGWRMPENTVSVARRSMWGNPYVVGAVYPDQGINKPLTAAEAVAHYSEWVLGETFGAVVVRAEIRLALRGKNLACWCPLGSPCHADVLLEVANAP